MSASIRPRYERRPDAISLALVLAHFSLSIAPVFLAAAIGPSPWLVVLWLWFGVGFHGMLNLWHEASHALVFRERWGNEVLGRWVLAPLLLGDFETYRKRHWDHHRFVGQERDTKDAYLLDLRGPRFSTFLLDCLTLREAVRKFRSTSPTPDGSGTRPMWLGRTALVQTLFLAALVAAARASGQETSAALLSAGLAWAAVYLYGLASLTLFVATLRSVAEHGVFGDGCPVVGRAALRNFECGPLERLVFGAYGFAEHATHHREPAIPSYRLREATDLLVRRGERDLTPQAGGYRARLVSAYHGA